MKKLLLTFTGALAASAMMAQTPSPSWTITQNAAFPMPSAGIRFMDAVSANDVWVVGYDGTAPSKNYNWFSKTNNGGTTWTSGNILPDTNSYVLANLEGIDANTAWVSAYEKPVQAEGAIFKTTDGGTTWVNMTAAGMYTNAASFTNIVAFLTPSVGITMGDPNGTGNEFEIWRTTDGGTSWSKIPGAAIPNPLSGEYGLVNIYAKQGTTNLWFGTNKGRIYRSVDGGLTWNVSVVAANTSGVNDIAFTDANNGVAFVYTSGSVFEMYNTSDGGVTWQMISNISPNVGKNDIAVVPGTNVFVSAGAGTGNNILSYSANNGVTWNDWGSTAIQYLTIDFFDANNGWAGSFSDPVNASTGGIFKYSGSTIVTIATASFGATSISCPFSTATMTNSSTGATSYSWSVAPSGSVSSPTVTNPTITYGNPGTYTITLVAANTSTSNTFSKVVTVSGCVGLNESTLANGISVFPNPAKDVLNIEVSNSDNFAVTVTNLLGKVILTEKSSKEKMNLNLSSIASGVYFVTIDAKGQKTTKKIIVE